MFYSLGAQARVKSVLAARIWHRIAVHHNWCDDEPNNYQGVEACMTIKANCHEGDTSSGHGWNDAQCTGSQHWYICEYELMKLGY